MSALTRPPSHPFTKLLAHNSFSPAAPSSLNITDQSKRNFWRFLHSEVDGIIHSVIRRGYLTLKKNNFTIMNRYRDKKKTKIPLNTLQILFMTDKIIIQYSTIISQMRVNVSF